MTIVTTLFTPPQTSEVAFTFATLLTDQPVYDAFRASLARGGFTHNDCEFLVVDNQATNRGDGYTGLNALMDAARGQYVVLCHQDLLLIDNRETLERALCELDQLDPKWALAGNAGGRGAGEIFIHVTGLKGEQSAGRLPALVYTLDENFIVLKRKSGVRCSCDLSGFHLYGSDIALNAEELGFTSYVIGFHLKHFGHGATGEAFAACRRAFQSKWSKISRHRVLQTPCTFMFLNPVPWQLDALQHIERSYHRLAKRIGRARLARQTTPAVVERDAGPNIHSMKLPR
jgi:hypothetical protein